MITHHVKVYPSKVPLPKTEQLAWKIATIATDKAVIDPAAGEMVTNRIIDNASVALAAINRTPVANARTQALAHPRAHEASDNELGGLVAGDALERGERGPPPERPHAE